MTVQNRRERFAGFEIGRGETGQDYDVDCRPALTGTALVAAVELEQRVDPEIDPVDPITYESPVTIFDGGRSFKFVASCPDNTPPGKFWVRVKLTDTQGRVSRRQWFQMDVV